MTTIDLSDVRSESTISFNDAEIDIDINVRKTSIFILYAKIFRFLFTARPSNLSLLGDEERDRELEELILPSNEEWRQQVYHRLVELQREKDAESEDEK